MSVPDVDEALALHGLTAADLPGIRDVWAVRFAVLDGPEIETVDDVASEILGSLNVARPRGGLSLVWAPQMPDCNDDRSLEQNWRRQPA